MYSESSSDSSHAGPSTWRNRRRDSRKQYTSESDVQKKRRQLKRRNNYDSTYKTEPFVDHRRHLLSESSEDSDNVSGWSDRHNNLQRRSTRVQSIRPSSIQDHNEIDIDFKDSKEVLKVKSKFQTLHFGPDGIPVIGQPRIQRPFTPHKNTSRKVKRTAVPLQRAGIRREEAMRILQDYEHQWHQEDLAEKASGLAFYVIVMFTVAILVIPLLVISLFGYLFEAFLEEVAAGSKVVPANMYN